MQKELENLWEACAFMDMAAVAWLSAFVQCYTHGSFWAGHSAAKTKSSSALRKRMPAAWMQFRH